MSSPLSQSGDIEAGSGSNVHLIPQQQPDSSEYLHNNAIHTCSWLSRVTFHWLNSLVWLGYKRPFQLSDLPPLDDFYLSEPLTQNIGSAMRTELRDSAHQQREFSLLNVLWKFTGRHWALSGILKFVSDICNVITPVLLSILIVQVKKASEDSASFWTAFVACVGLFLVTCCTSLCVNYYFQLVMLDGLRIKTALNGAIYSKIFRLSESAKLDLSTGMLVNLMSIDTGKLEILAGYLHYTWSGLLKTMVIMSLLVHTLGWAALAGLSVMVLSMPYHNFSIRQLTKLRKSNAGITDERVKKIQESLQAIRCVKAYCWEPWILANVLSLRAKELGNIRRMQIYRALLQSLSFAIPLFASIVTFGVYSWLGYPLLPEIVFPALAYFNLIRLPLILYPGVISMIIDAKVSLKRLETFFQADETSFVPSILPPNSEYSLDLNDASFIWTTKETPTGVVEHAGFRLGRLDLKIKKGTFVVVIGPVGSGKTSLLCALVGEMEHLQGQLSLSGPLGYCAQQAWIQNTTVRNNIVFGLPWDETKYRAVLHSCALEKDLEAFANGDLTEIGEKGITLSGGQKQRISLARMLYSEQPIVVMDDPLSAVDAHVGHWLLKKCILASRHTTRILVTHQLWLLKYADLVVSMEAGQISYQGSYLDLKEHEPRFRNLLMEHDLLEPASNDTSPENSVEQTMAGLHAEWSALTAPKLMQVEERPVGAVALHVYKSYVWHSGGVLYVLWVCVSLVFSQVSRVLTDLWLSKWTTTSDTYAASFPMQVDGTWVFFGWYVVLGLCQVFGSIVYSLCFSFGAVRSSERLFARAFECVLCSRVVVFDTMPLGRILNRFTKDLDGIDNSLSETLRSFASTLSMVFSSLILMSLVIPGVIPAFGLSLGLYWYLQLLYRSSSRELKRLDAITKSPLLAQFAETLSGLSTIRASHGIAVFERRNFSLSDTNNRPQFYQLILQRWLALRLEMVANLILVSISIFALLFSVSASLFGLLIAYALNLNGVLNWAVRQAGDTEVQMNAVERLLYYSPSNLPQERVLGRHAMDPDSQEVAANRTRIDPTCPFVLEFRSVSLRYRPELPLSLERVSFQIRPGERIGVVGRTGSGKSTLFSGVLRFVEIECDPGTGIFYYGADVRNLALPLLRDEYITMILQDPIFMSGTLRENLDPYQRHNDAEIWTVLQQVSMKTCIEKQCPLLLETVMTWEGEPFSLGQKQLVSLGRALLKFKRHPHGLLMMDEATANMDMSTDQFIQSTLNELFVPRNGTRPSCTLLTIAHRISTVLHYDRVMVLEKGRIVEMGSPEALSNNMDSCFYSLLQSSSI